MRKRAPVLGLLLALGVLTPAALQARLDVGEVGLGRIHGGLKEKAVDFAGECMIYEVCPCRAGAGVSVPQPQSSGRCATNEEGGSHAVSSQIH